MSFCQRPDRAGAIRAGLKLPQPASRRVALEIFDPVGERSWPLTAPGGGPRCGNRRIDQLRRRRHASPSEELAREIRSQARYFVKKPGGSVEVESGADVLRPLIDFFARGVPGCVGEIHAAIDGTSAMHLARRCCCWRSGEAAFCGV